MKKFKLSPNGNEDGMIISGSIGSHNSKVREILERNESLENIKSHLLGQEPNQRHQVAMLEL